MIRAFLSTVIGLSLVTQSVADVEIVNRGKGKVEDGVYHALDGSYTIKVPSLGAKSVTVQDAVISPGITHQVVFIGELGRSSMIISTKIQKAFPKNDLVLQRVASNTKIEFLQRGGFLEHLEFIGTEEGKILQAIVRYPRSGLQVQVRDGFTGELKPRRMDVLGIHRSVIREGFLIEFASLIPLPGPNKVFSEDKLLSQGITDANTFVNGARFADKVDENLQKLISEYKTKDDYIRFRIEAPVWDKPKS